MSAIKLAFCVVLGSMLGMALGDFALGFYLNPPEKPATLFSMEQRLNADAILEAASGKTPSGKMIPINVDEDGNVICSKGSKP